MTGISRDLYHGPIVLIDSVNGFSIDVPDGWIAGMDLDGLYGLEPVAHSDEYIYIMTRKCDLANVMKSMSSQLTLAHIRLTPTSELIANNNLTSAYFERQENNTSKHAFITASQISELHHVLFAAFKQTMIPDQLKYTTLALAASARKSINPDSRKKATTTSRH